MPGEFDERGQRIDKILGKCFVCSRAVRRSEAWFIVDHAVTLKGTNRKLRRLVHRQGCKDRAETMLVQPGKGKGSNA